VIVLHRPAELADLLDSCDAQLVVVDTGPTTAAHARAARRGGDRAPRQPGFGAAARYASRGRDVLLNPDIIVHDALTSSPRREPGRAARAAALNADGSFSAAPTRCPGRSVPSRRSCTPLLPRRSGSAEPFGQLAAHRRLIRRLLAARPR
jgi:hypothetical protein